MLVFFLLGLLFLIILTFAYALYRETTILFVKTVIIPLGAILVPFAIAYVGQIYSEAIKDKEVQAKLIEIATNILRETPTKDSTNLRTWAVHIINHYSEIKLSTAVQKDLIENVPIYGPQISVKITVVDEFGNAVEGAAVRLVKEVVKVFTELAFTHTDSKGEALIVTSDYSGGTFHIEIQKEGYELYSSNVQFIRPVTIIRASLMKRR
jgi:hypothetical protein